MKILNIGSMNIDYVYQVDHFVKPGETLSAKHRFVNCGGKGLNQSIAASKAGSMVYHAGLIGEGGEMLKAKLEEYHVNTAFLENTGGTCGHAMIQLDSNGENSILLFGGTNQSLMENYIDKVLDKFGNQGLVLLQNEINLIPYIIERAYERGLMVALNAAPMTPAVLQYPIEKLSWLIVNEIEGKELAKCSSDSEILSALAVKYPRCSILLTLGNKGACCLHHGILYKIGCHNVNAVDTTGAGDTFTGYFLSGIITGTSVRDSLYNATTASALCIEKKGASDSVPTMADIKECITSGRFPKLSIMEYPV